MKFKRLMMVTILLLAVLTIGAASAADDAISDDLAVSDESDAVVADPLDEGNDGNEVDPAGNGTGEDDGNGDGESQYGIFVNEEDIIIDEDNEDYDENATVAEMILPNDTTEGRFNAFVDGNEVFNRDISDENAWQIDEEGNLKSSIYLKDLDLSIFNDGDEIEFGFWVGDERIDEYTQFKKVYLTDSIINFYSDENEGEWDGEDGVIISVVEGDEHSFNIIEDLEIPFGFISIDNDLQGIIRISAYDEEREEDYIFFEKSLSDLTGEDDPDNEGFTIYYISLSDFDEKLSDILDWGYFEIGFYKDDEGDLISLDSREYNIEVDEDNENIIRFWQVNDEDEPIGEGEVLEGVEFRNANAKTNGVVVVIPMANFPQDIANEFSVIVITYDDEIHTGVRLDELEHDDSSYYIRVSDLGIDDLEIGEGIEVDIIVQFYDENDDPIYYAQTEEDEGIVIFNSPFIYDEASIFSDDVVISFQEIPDGVDEFNVTIQKEGEDAVVKTFKFSELENVDEEGGVWYELKLKDLGITETDDYEITVKFSEELNYTGNINVNRKMDIRIHNVEDNEGEETELREFTSIDEVVANLRISENIKGSVNLTIGENDPIVFDFADLKYDSIHPPDDGRRILLNDLNIKVSGTYLIKMAIYDENGDFIDGTEFYLLVTVGDNNVEFSDAYYTAEIYDTIKFTISTSLSSEQYYNIYFNDELAGKYSTDGIVLTNDKFYDLIWGDGEGDDVKFLKIGDYDVNITFFDGENESSALFAGKFSIKSLNMTADKDSYLEDENITISFDAQDPGEYYPVVYVQKTLGWGYMGPFFDEDWEMVFEGEKVAELIKDGKFTVNIGKLPLGTNYICVEYYLYESRGAYMEDDDALFAFHDLMPIKVISPVDPALTISVSNITEGASAVITITTNATFNGNVLVKIETANHTVSVVNGTGSAQVTGLAVGTHNATAIFEATDAFLASEKNTIFTVKAKVATAITASALTTTYATSKNIIVTLKDSNGNALTGKDVSIVLNGATKIVKTNDKGQATLAIGTALAPKTYPVTLSFAGDANYVKSTGTVKVTVNKAKPVLTAKKKTFKVKKAKKYTVALKTDKKKAMKNVKVTITGKFKGKKIKITKKTNKKGKVTFNLKKLNKKGKFKATIKFAGNKYYKAVSKKVKITVK